MDEFTRPEVVNAFVCAMANLTPCFCQGIWIHRLSQLNFTYLGHMLKFLQEFREEYYREKRDRFLIIKFFDEYYLSRKHVLPGDIVVRSLSRSPVLDKTPRDLESSDIYRRTPLNHP